MGVQDPFGMALAITRSLVETHRVGKGNFEQIIVARGDLFEGFRQVAHFRWGQFRQMGSRAVGHQQYFERPDRPERHQGGKTGILENDAFLTAVFLGKVIQQQRPTMPGKVGGLRVKLFDDLIR